MNNNSIFSKENLAKNQKLRKKISTIGLILLIIGIALDLVGFVDFFSCFGSFQPPKFFWCLFIGFPCTGIGIMLLIVANQGRIAGFQAAQTAPIRKDVTNYMFDGTRDEFVKTVNAVRGKKSKICPKCNTENDLDAAYCDNCGASLENRCPYCGNRNDLDAKYCKNCGKQL